MLDPNRSTDSSSWHGRSDSGGLPYGLIRILGLREGLLKVQNLPPRPLSVSSPALAPLLPSLVLCTAVPFVSIGPEGSLTFSIALRSFYSNLIPRPLA